MYSLLNLFGYLTLNKHYYYCYYYIGEGKNSEFKTWYMLLNSLGADLLYTTIRMIRSAVLDDNTSKNGTPKIQYPGSPSWGWPLK